MYCRWPDIQSIGLDILSNIAYCLPLDPIDPYCSYLFRVLNTFLNSSNKLLIIRALETIGKLCSNEKNEPLLCEYLDASVLRRVIALAAIKDVMLCVFVLECLYQISEMGPVPCERIAEQPSAYRVPRPHTAIMPHPTRCGDLPTTDELDGQQPPPLVYGGAVGSGGMLGQYHVGCQEAASSTPVPPPPLQLYAEAPSKRVAAVVTASLCNSDGHFMQPESSNSLSSPSSILQNHQAYVVAASATLTPKVVVASPVLSSSTKRVPYPNDKYKGPTVSVYQDQQIDSLTLNWIKQNCVADVASTVSRGELYANYVQDIRQHFKAIPVSANIFSNLIRQVFPSCIIRQLEGVSCKSSLMEIEGLRFIKQQTAGDVNSSSNVVAQHPLMQQMLSKSSSVGPCSPASSSQCTSPSLRNQQQQVSCAMTSGQCRPDSVGTCDSYSMPNTPDSVSSSISATASNEQIASSTAITPKKRSARARSRPKAKHRNASSSSPVVVNGLPISYQLEVCHPALEATSVIDINDMHEAKIVRVENATFASNNICDGAFKSEVFVNGGGDSVSDTESSTTSVVGDTMRVVNHHLLHHQEVSTGKFSFVVNGSVAAGGKCLSPVLANGLVRPASVMVSADTESACNAPPPPPRNRTPTPDMELMKRNVNMCQKNIQQLLLTTSNKHKSTTLIATTSLVATSTSTSAKRRRTIRRKLDAANATDQGESPDSACAIDDTAPKAFPPATMASEPPRCLNSSETKVFGSGGGNGYQLASSSSSLSLSDPVNVASTSDATPTAAAASTCVASAPLTPVDLRFMCEWDGCGKLFSKIQAVYFHVCKVHVNEDTSQCKWTNCDQTVRLKWSVIAHLQDAHCNEKALRTAAIRRYEISACGRSNIQEPQPPPPHPGYPPDAALAAIRRHALVNLPKDFSEGNEGPVTKSIRLTAALIIRNLARFSSLGTRLLRRHESLLCFLAFRRLESSSVIAQSLAEMNVSSPRQSDSDST
ncbi:unnamed protein product [Soboliphyme baturini]|uniref:RFX-type winged-helix domain-containing protein n=1 Tax=Soboliphyme baturini TaxID=241478 RepID=A0A183IWW7_9BILA|nr:unnamed protein product [Soboliphyme baturini]